MYHIQYRPNWINLLRLELMPLQAASEQLFLRSSILPDRCYTRSVVLSGWHFLPS